MRKKFLLKLIVYFIIGYILFNFIFSLTQTILLTNLGFPRSIIDVSKENYRIIFITYTIVYILIVLLNLIYNIKIANTLNKKLKKIKERGGINEK